MWTSGIPNTRRWHRQSPTRYVRRSNRRRKRVRTTRWHTTISRTSRTSRATTTGRERRSRGRSSSMNLLPNSTRHRVCFSRIGESTRTRARPYSAVSRSIRTIGRAMHGLALPTYTSKTSNRPFRHSSKLCNSLLTPSMLACNSASPMRR